jgi:ferredoxin
MKRLFIDIPQLLRAGDSIKSISCEYLFHRTNDGHFSLLEVAEFASYCRQCLDAFCVLACPVEALERTPSGTSNASTCAALAARVAFWLAPLAPYSRR